MSNPHAAVLVFLAGVGAGWLLAFRFARAVERVRRYRQDLRTTLAGVRGLVAGTRREGLMMVKVGLVVAGIAVLATVVVLRAA